jgi:signal transduction histidine kinase
VSEPLPPLGRTAGRIDSARGAERSAEPCADRCADHCAERLTLLAHAQELLAQPASETGVFSAIAEAVQRVVPSAACDIFVTGDNEWQCAVHLVQGHRVSSARLPLADLSLARLTAATGVSRLASHRYDGIGVPRGTTELCAAVRFGQHSTGVIRLLSAPAAPFDAQDLDLLTIIARHAGTAVARAQLVSRQDQQRQQRQQRDTIIAPVAASGTIAEQLPTIEKMVALGELVGGVAHDINNPLTGISAFAQLLLEEELSATQRESVQLIKQESDRATQVIRDLLHFARTSERETGPVSVNAVLEQTVRLRAYPLRVANVHVQLDLDARAPAVNGNPQKLQQVLLNVMSNAEYAMQDRHERVLMLQTRLDGDSVCIMAHDTGHGMSPEVQRHIFEPFFSTKPAGAGTGLGMSVSHGIILAHGGTIGVASEAGVGTTVTIRLPALSASPAGHASP